MTEALPSFSAFYEAVHGRPPFLWQARLAEQVCNDRKWPSLLDIPTGFGKTSALDIALYCLAALPDVMPRRAVLVIDRRVVVDQGALHAQKILQALRAATGGPAFAVAQALRALFDAKPDEDPFAVAVMRGGMPRDNDWAKRPDQPMLGVSTVDQVGSRLLFRGYGLSKRAAPIHAGLIAHDTLILLDEVHLAVPFAQTLDAIQRRYRQPASSPLPDRSCVVQMSATLRADAAGERFCFDPGRDLRDDRSSDRLRLRLHAPKPARLEVVKLKANDPEPHKRAAIADAAAEAALKLVEEGAQVVGVVVNRVDTVRLTQKRLAKHAERVQVISLTGRMRPLDRDHVTQSDDFKRALMGASRADTHPAKPPSTSRRAPSAPQQGSLSFDVPTTPTDPTTPTPTTAPRKPLVIVATQCIEAGADLDLDGLVTECASLDALRQRFGRLNRSGERSPSRAVILGRSDAKADKPDPIYGAALAQTWGWLQDNAQGDTVDFGLSALAAPTDPDQLAKLLAPAANAPTLLPAHLDAWAQTSPPPATDPDISLWLHGPERASADVQVIWRADLPLPSVQAVEAQRTPATEDTDALKRKDLAELARRRLSACRPSSLEAVSLPIYVARAWLSEQDDVPSPSDMIGGDTDEPTFTRPRRGAKEPPLVAFRWSGDDDDSDWVTADDIRPGDVLILHTDRGGLSQGCFDPTASAPVTDLGDLANLRARGRASLRLSAQAPALLSVWHLPTHLLNDAPDDDLTSKELSDWVTDWLKSLPDTLDPSAIGARDWPRVLGLKRGPRTIQEVEGVLYVSANKRLDDAATPSRALAVSPELEDTTSEDDDSAFCGQKGATLEGHCDDVAAFARGFAARLGLPAKIARSLEWAARLHDVGKADERFQRWLVNGDEVERANQPALLAKSSRPAGSLRQREEARLRAGYPKGYRHELLSVSLLEGSADFRALADAEGLDRDLTLHLVGSHHGCCRPFAPLLDHPEDAAVSLTHKGVTLSGSTRHRLARLDSGVPDRFWRLVGRYGWWGLAWLEAILRLADHRASEAGERVNAREGR